MPTTNAGPGHSVDSQHVGPFHEAGWGTPWREVTRAALAPLHANPGPVHAARTGALAAPMAPRPTAEAVVVALAEASAVVVLRLHHARARGAVLHVAPKSATSPGTHSQQGARPTAAHTRFGWRGAAHPAAHWSHGAPAQPVRQWHTPVPELVPDPSHWPLSVHTSVMLGVFPGPRLTMPPGQSLHLGPQYPSTQNRQSPARSSVLQSLQ